MKYVVTIGQRALWLLFLFIGTWAFVTTAQAQTVPQLWVVNEDNGALYSIANYEACGASTDAGLVAYGRLTYHDGRRVRKIGTEVESLAMDPTGVLYMYVNKNMAGFSGPVLVSLDTKKVLRDGITQVDIKGGARKSPRKFNGAAFHPQTGDLYVVWDRSGVDELLIVSKEDGRIIRTIGRIQGQGNDAQDSEDMAFASDGTLYISDNKDDHLYRVDPATAAIEEVLDTEQRGGLGLKKVKVEGLTWDPINNRLIASDDDNNGFFNHTLENGNNEGYCFGSKILKDIEGIGIVPAVADISVKKAIDKTNPSEGANVTFTLTVFNEGPNRATDLTIADPLPDGLTFQNAIADAGTYDADTGIWTIEQLNNRVSAELMITATATTAGTFTNTAELTTVSQPDPDSAPDNQVANEDDYSTVQFTVLRTGAIAGRVFNDADADQAQGSGEDGIADATLTLMHSGADGQCGTGDDEARGSRQASADGDYTFADLLPGTYCVGVDLSTLPADFENTTSNIPSPVVLEEGEDKTDVDFGFRKQVPEIRISPVLECVVSNANGTTTALFGYFNPSDAAIDVPIGDRNRFTPDSADRGQPTTFAAGRVYGAFTVDFNGDNLVWSLTEKTSTANANSKQCEVADLSIAKTVSNRAPVVGTNVSFTVTLLNDGPNASPLVEVTDKLPASLELVTATPSQGSYDPNTGLWSVGAVEADQRHTLSLVAKVLAAGEIVNTAEVSRSAKLDPDSTPGNGAGEDDRAQTVLVAIDNAPTGQCFAASVVDFNQGRRKDGGAVASNRSDPMMALGEPQDNDTFNFVSLGFEGTLTLQMDGIIPNLPGDDVRVVETTFGNSSCSRYPERIKVFASQDGANYVELGNACQDGTFDLGDLPSATFIRVQDTTDPNDFNGAADAYDVDAIVSLNCRQPEKEIADLSITKEVSDLNPAPNEAITFTVTLHNDGPQAATGLVVRDVLPFGLEHTSSSASLGTYEPVGGVWDVGRLNNGETATLVITVNVSPLVDGFMLENVAQVIFVDQADPDSQPANGVPSEDDEDNALVYVGSAPLPPTGFADLSVTKVVDDAFPELNDDVTFTVTLSNDGPDEARGVVVRDQLPYGLSFVSATPSTGTYDENTGFWDIGDVPVGSSITLELVATVIVSNLLENVAQVIYVGAEDPDSIPGNGDPEEDDQAAVIVEAFTPSSTTGVFRPECEDTGSINALVYDTQNKVIYAASEAGRIHVSNDNGENWPPFLSLGADTPIRSLFVAEGVAYAGTFGVGAYSSTDGGTTWNELGPGRARVADFSYDAANNHLYAALDTGVGIYDVDNGTWEEVGAASNPFVGRQVEAVHYDAQTQRVFASVTVLGAFVFDGNTWSETSAGLPGGTVYDFIETASGELLAATHADGVYRYNRGSQDWRSFGTGLDNQAILSLNVGPTGTLLASSLRTGLYRYVNGAWAQVPNLPAFTVQGAVSNESDEIFAGTPGDGIYRFSDNTGDDVPDTWFKITDFLVQAVINDLVVGEDEVLYAGTYGFGMMTSDDGGQCWLRISRGLTNPYVIDVALTPSGTLFAGTWADGLGGVWRSRDDGRTWNNVGLGNRQILSLALDPDDENTIYAGANLAGIGSIYRSTDGGDTWDELDSFTSPVWSIIVDPSDANRLFTGTLDNGVFQSKDRGITWTSFGSTDNGLTSNAIFELEFGAPDTPFNGIFFAGTRDGLFRLQRSSATWERFGQGTEGKEVRSIAFSQSTAYVGTWGDGVLEYNPAGEPNETAAKSANDGTWEQYALAGSQVPAVLVQPEEETVMMGTDGEGLYLGEGSDVTVVFSVTTETDELPTAYALAQNYPNPFNPQTTIEFTLPQANQVRLVVYDLLGRQVAVLVDGPLTAGNHRVLFDASPFASGMYLYRLEMPNQALVKKMVLVK